MTASKKFWLTITLAVIGGLAILITAYIVNGSEHEDAWLYVFSGWLILYAGWEAYSQRKVKKQ